LNCARANEIAYLKFPVCGRSTQASIQAYTRTRAQWSHASVGLAQARPNYEPEHSKKNSYGAVALSQSRAKVF